MKLDSFCGGLWCLVVSASMSYVGGFVATGRLEAKTAVNSRFTPGQRAIFDQQLAKHGGDDEARAGQGYRVPMTEVSEALRVLAADGGSPLACGAEDVEGSWELVFSTQLKSGYMPIRELVGFYPSREEASIDATAGPLPIGGMRGKCWWRGGEENELAFMLGAVKLGPFKFGKDKNEVKTYKFFVNDGKVLAARSSAGGFALLSRVPEEG